MRRYDLDWLRVLVFGLLIFYHVGMFFVPWGFHIKNNVIYDFIKWPMLFVNQWRLPILFLISGMGTFYALSYRSILKFNIERFKRLIIPLAFGMLFIVPPQVYFERLANNQFTGSYINYYLNDAFNGIYPEGNLSWHHLWFLPYLFVFSVCLSSLFVYLKNHSNKFISWISKITMKPFGLYIFIIPLYLTEALVEPFFPVTHALINDWFYFTNFLILFFYGFLLISIKEHFWKALNQIKKTALIIGIISFGMQLFIWLQMEDSTLVHFTEALIKVVNLWSWILVILGYGSKYLNKPSRILKYCNRAVYPFYILHQTITIGIAYYLIDLNWSFGLKFTILSIGTFILCWLIYHFLILKIKFLHPLFGLKR
ncbi:acyltransferase family protein [Flavobacteriaceae bacterium R38]|nr:acyltransferase family protein [Flavobacteriaceae bacterium R38]